MKKLESLKQHLQPGRVYRRAELARWSNAVDRHLKQLLEAGTLVKLSGGLYHYPKHTTFGEAPVDDESLVRAFLKDDRFLITSPNAYNTLGVGTTQLYNQSVVYNYKRHGTHRLGGRVFDFKVKPDLPKNLNKEFLLVDLVNNLDKLAENAVLVQSKAKVQARTMNRASLHDAVKRFGTVATKKFFADALGEDRLSYA